MPLENQPSSSSPNGLFPGGEWGRRMALLREIRQELCEFVNLKLNSVERRCCWLEASSFSAIHAGKNQREISLPRLFATPSEDTNCVPGVINGQLNSTLPVLPTPMTRIHDTKNSRDELVIILEGGRAILRLPPTTVLGFGFFLEREFMGG